MAGLGDIINTSEEDIKNLSKKIENVAEVAFESQLVETKIEPKKDIIEKFNKLKKEIKKGKKKTEEKADNGPIDAEFKVDGIS